MPFTDEQKLFFNTLFSEANKGKNADQDIAAIAHVIKNRTLDAERFGGSLGEVILTPKQFSGVGSNEFMKASNQQFTPQEEKIYKKVVQIGSGVLSGKIKDPTGGANHYFNPKLVKPSWSKKMKKTYSSGSHDFYVG